MEKHQGVRFAGAVLYQDDYLGAGRLTRCGGVALEWGRPLRLQEEAFQDGEPYWGIIRGDDGRRFGLANTARGQGGVGAGVSGQGGGGLLDRVAADDMCACLSRDLDGFALCQVSGGQGEGGLNGTLGRRAAGGEKGECPGGYKRDLKAH